MADPINPSDVPVAEPVDPTPSPSPVPAAEPVAVTPDGGVTKTVLEAGQGEPLPSDARVALDYTLTLEDGTVLDSTHSRGKPLSFRLGANTVLPGLEILAASMLELEHATATIAPFYAFGAAPPPSVPANAALTVDATLARVEDRGSGKRGGGVKSGAGIAAGGRRRRTRADVRGLGEKEVWERAREAKEEGNGLFKEAKYARAIGEYEESLALVQDIRDERFDREMEEEDAREEEWDEEEGLELKAPKVVAEVAKAEVEEAAGRVEEEAAGGVDGEVAAVVGVKTAETNGDGAVLQENGVRGGEAEASGPAILSACVEELTTQNGDVPPEIPEPAVPSVPVDELTTPNGDAPPGEPEPAVPSALATTPNGGAAPGEPNVVAKPATESSELDAVLAEFEKSRQTVRENAVSDAALDELELTLLNNLALCLIKEGKHAAAAKFATRALRVDPANAKSLYYRGRARFASGDYEEARADLKKAQGIQPTNSGIRFELEKVEKKIKSHLEGERRRAAAMFS